MKRIDCPVFDGLTDQEYECVFDSIKPREEKVSRGATVYRYSSKEKELAILCDGVANVVKIDADGNLILLERLVKGSIFGNSVSYGEHNDEISVTAETECRIVYFKFCDIIVGCNGECGYKHKLLVNIIDVMRRKTAAIGERTEIIGNRTTRDKLLCYFRLLIERSGGKVAKLDMSLTALAEYICADRSAMMRELKRLKDDGLISIDHKIVKLNNN